MIHPITDVRITVAPGVWPLDDDTRRRIADHWATAVAANPRLWNGRVFGTLAPGRPGGLAIENGVLAGSAVETDFADFLAWRDWGFPEIGIRNLFGSAAVLTSDGALIYGVMGGHTANAGRIYPPGGSLEPRDVTADGRLHVVRSIELELQEETGLEAGEATVEGMVAVFDGPRVSVARLFRFSDDADRLAARIRDTLSAQEHRELDDVVLLRTPADADDPRVPPYARALAAHLLG
jgi:8-oxo-dGTP pyrophosphatase MutT (NUDIX family)